jgi:hypothetical protein
MNGTVASRKPSGPEYSSASCENESVLVAGKVAFGLVITAGVLTGSLIRVPPAAERYRCN